MRHLVAPTDVAGIRFVVDVACMCSAAAGMVGAAAVLVLSDIHCLLANGDATDDVVVVVATVDNSDAGSDIVSVSVVAGVVDAGVATWVLSVAVLSMPLVCPVQTCPSPSIFSLSFLVQLLFHPATFCAACAYMHLRTCGRHLF